MKRGNKYENMIKTDLKALDLLEKRFQDVAAKSVRWGYFDSKYEQGGRGGKDTRAGLPVAVLALWHEYRLGMGQGNYPRRPFFTDTFPIAAQVCKNFAPFVYGLAATGRSKDSIQNAFQHRLSTLAKFMCRVVQKSIDDGNFTPLAPATIAAKGHDKILIETGQLRNKIQWMIYSRKAYGKNKEKIGNVGGGTVERLETYGDGTLDLSSQAVRKVRKAKGASGKGRA